MRALLVLLALVAAVGAQQVTANLQEFQSLAEEAALVPTVSVSDNYQAASNADDLITKALEHGTLSAAQAKAILAAAKAAAEADAAKVGAAKKIVEAAKAAQGEVDTHQQAVFTVSTCASSHTDKLSSLAAMRSMQDSVFFHPLHRPRNAVCFLMKGWFGATCSARATWICSRCRHASSTHKFSYAGDMLYICVRGLITPAMHTTLSAAVVQLQLSPQKLQASPQLVQCL
jgi:hypothetical protein